MKAMRYISLAGTISSAILIAVFVTCIYVDPYGLDIATGTQPVLFSDDALSHSRVHKAHAVKRIRPNAIVLGSSRAEHGLQMSHQGWSEPPGRRYNLALTDVQLREMIAFFVHAHQVDDVRQVVVGLDLFWFNAYNDEVHPDFDPLALEDGSYTASVLSRLHLLKAYMNGHALVRAIRLIRRTDASFDSLDAYGSTTVSIYERNAQRAGGYVELFKATAHSYLKAANAAEKRGKLFSFQHGDAPSTLSDFRRILDLARQHKVDLRLMISPSHAWDMELTRLTDRWELFEVWKRTLVRVASEEGAAHSSTPYAIWDFSGYNAVTSEAVIGANGTLRGYWDPSHYKQSVGDLVLSQIFDDTPKPQAEHPRFGVRLTPDNIEDHLVRINADRALWARNNPEEARYLATIARRDRGGTNLAPASSMP